ncbi:E3 ubiquitin/ISG15 ligase TRIM25-like [Bufo bufo]|uniref:E3 ubiquitin/ISG15 ligase TRIM25-like n=1 Tax=Bufo bufo TaxID=8384 RepID=UPI001ABEC3AB|nr:E3 ubiquitin/ISG15 ligase TRIM25-like [Bufo bufo]
MASAPETCCICLTKYTEEVTLRCGHSVCQGCIDQVQDTQAESKVNFCPKCKEPEEHPSLKTWTWRNEVEELPSSQVQEVQLVIPCSYCIHSSTPAVKTCLHCEASLCDDHLRVHIKSPEHVLSKPTTVLEEQKCSVHRKILEYYCNEDETCICVYCLAETHRTHQLEPLNEATEKRKERLKDVLQTLDTKREKTDKEIQNLLKGQNEIPDKVTSLTETVTALFTEIRRQLEDLEKKVLSEVSRQKVQVTASISNLIQQLEIQKDELSSEIRHIEKLLTSTDPSSVLKCQVVTFLDGVKKNDAEETDKNIHSSGNLNHFLIALTIYDGLGNIVTKAKEDFYVIESSEILLDKNTAANNVAITEDLKSATWSVMSQRRKETPKRFQQYQVFSIQGILSGQHYWEVEASEAEYWMVGMAYPSTETEGEQSWIGNNKRSWCFCRWHEEYSIRHNSKDIQLFSGMSSNRYGIHVDYDSGQLSFYHLCEPIRHVYTFSGTFTEPLHAAFWVNDNGWIKIRKS